MNACKSSSTFYMYLDFSILMQVGTYLVPIGNQTAIFWKSTQRDAIVRYLCTFFLATMHIPQTYHNRVPTVSCAKLFSQQHYLPTYQTITPTNRPPKCGTGASSAQGSLKQVQLTSILGNKFASWQFHLYQMSAGLELTLLHQQKIKDFQYYIPK